MPLVYAHGAFGTYGHEAISAQAVTFTPGAAAQVATPVEAAKAFQKALAHGFVSSGTFIALTGATAVTVPDVNVTATSAILVYLLTAAGTVGAIPHVTTKTPGTGFTVINTASDTSVYGYIVVNPAA